MDMLKSEPFIIPPTINQLELPSNMKETHPLRRRLEQMGCMVSYVDLNLSTNLVEIAMNSWSKGTQKQCSLHINRWFNYGRRHNIHSFDSSVKQSAEFLAEYFHEGVSYSMVNTARSALSSIFPAKDGTPFGKHSLIVRLLRGMLKQKPFLPRYTVNTDVAKMLQYISNSYSKMSLECLTKKLNTNYTHINEKHCIFYIASLLKTTRPGFLQHLLEFKRYTNQKNKRFQV